MKEVVLHLYDLVEKTTDLSTGPERKIKYVFKGYPDAVEITLTVKFSEMVPKAWEKEFGDVVGSDSIRIHIGLKSKQGKLEDA